MNDEDDIRYSRQSYTLGKVSSFRIHKSNVLIIGYSTLSLEIIKNLVLTGINAIDIYIGPLFKLEKYQKTGLYFGDITHKETIDKLKLLNPTVSINIINKKDISELEIKKYNLLIATNIQFKDAININRLARENNIPFILSGLYGLMCYIFNDFGKEYFINDVDGETYEHLHIEEINKLRIKFKEPHLLGNGDILHFLINKDGAITVVESTSIVVKNVISPLEIETTIQSYSSQTHPCICSEESSYKEYTTMIKKKVNKDIKFIPLEESINKPEFIEYNERNIAMHILNKAHNDFYEYNKRSPRAQNKVDYELFKEYIYKNNINNIYNDNNELFNLAQKFCKTIKGNMLPLVSIIGGIVSQEAIKVIGSIYIPITQWLYIDYIDLAIDANIFGKSEYYEGYANIFGKELFEKIQNTKTFIAGSGAIGCELLKHLGSMGIKNIIVTDMDNIEKSNLSRQFLFSDKDLNKSKSVIASNKINEMYNDKNIKITPYELKLCKETETTFNSTFYHNNVDIILNALDNIEARKYVDQQSIKYSKPLIDSGTMGTKGNVQVILPFITDTYGSMEDPDDNKGIPICTIKSFPYKNEHTIQWARELFEQEFTQHASIFIHTEGTIDSKTDNEIDILYNKYYKYSNFTLSSATFTHILNSIFIDNYYNNIIELIKKHKDDEYKKKMPELLQLKEIEIEKLLVQYYKYGFAILNQMFNSHIELPTDLSTPSMISIPYDQEVINIDIKREVCKNVLNKLSKINKISFNKDDDDLNHVDWLVVVANLRNIQYSIPLTAKYETRKIAGNIIPALITTTSIIAGYQIMEYIKTIIYYDKNNPSNCDLSKFNNIYLNTSINFYGSATPSQITKKIIGKNALKISLWDKIMIPKSITSVIDILEQITKQVDCTIEFMTWGNEVVYDGDDIIKESIDLSTTNAVILLKDYTNINKEDNNDKFIEMIVTETHHPQN
jgi:ubiquitin-activating enzyme E1